MYSDNQLKYWTERYREMSSSAEDDTVRRWKFLSRGHRRWLSDRRLEWWDHFQRVSSSK